VDTQSHPIFYYLISCSENITAVIYGSKGVD